MKTEYGAWKPVTKIHITGYDGKWLCGRSGATATDAGLDLDQATCVLCNKRLEQYAVKHLIPSDKVQSLREALKSLQEMSKRAKGQEGLCGVEGMPEGVALFLDSWVIPQIEDLLMELDGGQND